MTTLSFSGGTFGAAYTVPGSHVGYGSWKYPGAANDQVFANNGTFAQMVDASTITSNFTGSTIVAWGGTADSSEAAVCCINAAQTGWSAIFTGTTVLLRKEVAGSGGATITAAVTSGLTTAGDYTIGWTFNPTTGAITVSVNSVQKTTGTYTDTLTGLRGGIQNFNASNGHAFKNIITNQVATYTVDTVTTGGSSGLKVGQPFAFTTTGLTSVTATLAQTAALPAAQTTGINIVQTAGDGTAATRFFVDGQYMPFAGSVTFTATGPEGSPTKTIPFAIPDDHLDVQFGAVSLQDATYLGYTLNAIGHPLASGDRAYWVNSNSLVYATDGKISCLSAMTSLLWVHKNSGIIEGYTVQINDAGAITNTTKISTRRNTSAHISSRKATKVHLQ